MIAIDDLDPNRPLPIRAITSDPRDAMAYCGMRMLDGDDYDMFVIIRLDSDGLIGSYRWLAQPAL